MKVFQKKEFFKIKKMCIYKQFKEKKNYTEYVFSMCVKSLSA